ncbi:MAG TPA: outer membrane protein transport protein [Guyparkeria sp.]|nr:outer membrane protein transport protein [Guyparkeria sp.]
MKITKRAILPLAIAAALAAPAAQATNGYFKIGYGAKAAGMGGAGIAYAQDSLAPATNPAGLSLVGDRVDLGLQILNVNRDARIDAIGAGGTDTDKIDSGATLFALPHAGFARDMGDYTLGLSITANGGMSTRYNSNLITDAFAPAVMQFGNMLMMMNPFGAPTIMSNMAGLAANPNTTPSLGLDMKQAILAPTISTQLNDNHSVGASLLIGYQQFRAYGLGMFQPLSGTPESVTNNGNDDAWGAGLRIGWTGQITDSLTLGAQASSKVYMQKFNDYEGLLAEQGGFDIPAQVGLGLAYELTDKTTVAVDVQHIMYGDVDALANPGPDADAFIGALVDVLQTGAYAGDGQLGADGGWGFGWDDVTVVKVGVDHRYNEKWTFRGGINYGENPISDEQNLFGVLAPYTVQTHLTAGFTYHPSRDRELSVSYTRALDSGQDHTFTGDPAGAFAGFSYDTEIGMDQNALEVSYSMKF